MPWNLVNLSPFYQTEKYIHIYFSFQGEGFLTIETLSSILLELEPSLGKDELQDIIDEVDEDGSGTIDFDGKNNVEYPVRRQSQYDVLLVMNATNVIWSHEL